jgi:hypothetical protein
MTGDIQQYNKCLIALVLPDGCRDALTTEIVVFVAGGAGVNQECETRYRRLMSSIVGEPSVRLGSRVNLGARQRVDDVPPSARQLMVCKLCPKKYPRPDRWPWD